MSSKLLVVIGGGAAGFFCAVNAARMNRELKVLILEKTGKILSKVKVSGGGRCNVTHQCHDIGEMVSHYPRGGRLLKKAFHHFFTSDTIAWFAERNVNLVAEADGRMFPSTNRSQTIIDCLVQEMNRYAVELQLNAAVTACEKRGNRWHLALAQGKEITADYVCVACGGFSRPESLAWIAQTGHRLVDPVPSLFTFNLRPHPFPNLMGVAVPAAKIKIAGSRWEEKGPLLITHWGLSGPAVLRLSAWAARDLAERQYHFDVLVNWNSAFNEQSAKQLLLELRRTRGSQLFIQRNEFGLPARLWQVLAELSGIGPDQRWADIPAQAMNLFCQHCCGQRLSVRGKTTFKEEFVTAGGVDCAAIDPQTFQSRIHQGLFFAGEILDVDGITGGYNFQHAWTSGYLAARAIAQNQPAE